MSSSEHYQGSRGAAYFERREALRHSSAQAKRAALFKDLPTAGGIVLDFGCGTGGVLMELPAAMRIGVEISELAAQEARKRLDQVVPDLSGIADDSVDIVISYHALEHVEAPISVLRGLWRVLKPKGKVRIIVPSETALISPHHRSYEAGDMDMHLHTWTPMLIGNAMKVAGFEIEDARMIPGSDGISVLNSLGNAASQFGKWVKALHSGRIHVIATATKPA